MDAARFDHWTRVLATVRTRRVALRAAAGSLAVATGFLTAPRPVDARRRLLVACDYVPESFITGDGDGRLAETFVATRNGKLSRAKIVVEKLSGSSGDYILRISPVSGSDVPTNDVLAETTVSDARLAEGGPVTITGKFAKATAAQLVAGTRYALVVTRPGSGANQLRVSSKTGDPCPETEGIFISESQTASFGKLIGADIAFKVFIGY
jgi:hypothetical protein